MTVSPAILYLFPVPMGEAKPVDVLPHVNIEIIRGIRFFIVENIRSARRFLKACDKNINIDQISFVELNEHTSSYDVEAMLQPLNDGHDIGIISEAGCPAVADPGADAVAI
ncbi:MAG: SAM-dependent methyltransferase, partial [Muribaculaceae bacterium]|nr:SAM-dependent methyltransferase [Muribaculaceae bacterium]